jgi:hypothetical protein
MAFHQEAWMLADAMHRDKSTRAWLAGRDSCVAMQQGASRLKAADHRPVRR